MNITLTPGLLAKPLGAVFVLAGLCAFWVNAAWGYAALAGGLSAWLSQVFFAKRIQSAFALPSHKQFMRVFYRAEMLKLMVAACLLTPAIVFARAPGLPLLASYGLIQTGWMLWLLRGKAGALLEWDAKR